MESKLRNLGLLRVLLFSLAGFGLVLFPAVAQETDDLSVMQIMNGIIVPMTNTLWGAYEIQSDETWQELQNAAISVIAAGQLLKSTGSNATEDNWQQFNNQMITAAQAALLAIDNKDEEALFNAGNDQLYPPCESCHQQYMAQ